MKMNDDTVVFCLSMMITVILTLLLVLNDQVTVTHAIDIQNAYFSVNCQYGYPVDSSGYFSMVFAGNAPSDPTYTIGTRDSQIDCFSINISDIFYNSHTVNSTNRLPTSQTACSTDVGAYGPPFHLTGFHLYYGQGPDQIHSIDCVNCNYTFNATTTTTTINFTSNGYQESKCMCNVTLSSSSSCDGSSASETTPPPSTTGTSISPTSSMSAGIHQTSPPLSTISKSVHIPDSRSSSPSSLPPSGSSTPSDSCSVPPRFNLSCGHISQGECLVSHPVIVSHSQILQFNYSVLNIDSSFVLDNSTVVSLSSDQIIKVKDNATFGGVLQLVLTDQIVSQVNNNSNAQVQIATFDEYDGQFSSLQIVNEDRFLCGITNTAQYESKSLSVLIQKNSCTQTGDGGVGDGGGEKTATISTGVIIGIVIGVCGFVVIVIVVGAIAITIIAFVIKKRMSDKMRDEGYNLAAPN